MECGLIKLAAEKMTALMPRMSNKASVLRLIAKFTPNTKQTTKVAIINGKRRNGVAQFFDVAACQRFVTKMGMTMNVKVVSGSRKLTNTAMAIIGKPMPVTPLTTPPSPMVALMIAISSTLRPNLNDLGHGQQVP